MKKIFKNIIFILVILLALVILVVVPKRYHESTIESVSVEKVVAPVVAPVSTAQEVTVKKVEKLVGPQIVIEVAGKIHNAPWQRGETLFELLTNLQKNNEAFSFKTKSYSSLGEFVYEINGIQESPGNYWLYYVNGKQGSVGISKYVVQEGDSIVWKQE